MAESLSKLLLVVGITSSLAIGTVIAAWQHMLVCKCDLDNWQALLVEGVVLGGGLGSFFYFLQRKSSRWYEGVIAGRYVLDTQRKEFWVAEAISQLGLLKSDLRNLDSYYETVLKESPNDERLNEIQELIELDKFRVLNDTAVRLNAAMSQIADLLKDNSLFRDVRASDFTWYLETADVRMSPDEINEVTATIAIRLIEIDSLLQRLEDEGPIKKSDENTPSR
ncbi:hypothetical protein [Candidatus Nitrososphaera sp. FF02]|uniref:hypothetical protein n=1 Tax=Candidatus Nitrososphaera sp. FF02 TaxID=3398226 RepID=UPI0039E9F090